MTNRQQRRAGQAPRVVLAYLHPGDVSAAFMASTVRCLMYEAARTGQVPGTIERRARSGRIANARNELTAAFLASNGDWLWFVDADMGFPANALEHLLASADRQERPVVGALCFGSRVEGFDDHTNAEQFGCFPTLYVWAETGFRNVENYPRDSLFKVSATGAACILIHRSALETMRTTFGENWWSLMDHPITGDGLSEDTAFCVRAIAAGLPIYANTAVKTSHDKGGVFLTEQAWDAQHRAIGPDTDSLVVLVPVLNRPQNVQPLIESFATSGAPGRLLFIATATDTAEVDELDRREADYLLAPKEGWPAKINYGYAHSSEDWMLCAADDIRFHPGWWQATRVARMSTAGVVGTNDLGNPAVIRGDHATHPLVRRIYVDQYGTLDGPGQVVHDGYHHWYVDNELVETAKARGMFQPCLDSVVEHLHHRWGRGEYDDTYQLGEAHTEADRHLYERRLGLVPA